MEEYPRATTQNDTEHETNPVNDKSEFFSHKSFNYQFYKTAVILSAHSLQTPLIVNGP